MSATADIDEFLLPVWEYVASFGGDLLEEDQLRAGGMSIDSVLLDMPLELVVVTETEQLRVFAAPPTQHLETSVMPVLHRIAVRLEPQ